MRLFIGGLWVKGQATRLQESRKAAFLFPQPLSSRSGYRCSLLRASTEHILIVRAYSLLWQVQYRCSQLYAFTKPRQNAGCSKWYPCKAAGEARIGGVTFLTRPPQAARQLVLQVGYVEDFGELRTTHREKRVSARRGWAGEKKSFSASC